MILKAVPLDILYICAELITGKSIPVLVGITRLPIGQGLAWTSVFMGAVVGTFFSIMAARRTHTMSLLSFLNRLLQLSFSLGLSISLVLSLAKGTHAVHGTALSVIPAFCVVMQALPQRHSTALVSFILCLTTLYVCTLISTIEDGKKTTSVSLEDALKNMRSVSVQPPSATSEPVIALTLAEIIQRAFQLFALGFYASIQHAPTQVYFDTKHQEGVWDSSWECQGRPVYASHYHASYASYSFLIGFVSAWIRVGIWSIICFMQDHMLHLMLENEDPGSWSWICSATYTTALLYSACWTATQLKEQVLPRFCIEEETERLKFFVCIFAFATVFRQHDPAIMFYATNVFAAISVLTVYTTLRA